MHLPDVNLLVYALRADRPEHERARDWLLGALAGPAPLAICSSVTIGFARIVTHPGIFGPPATIEATLAFLAEIHTAPATLPLEPGPEHPALFAEICRISGAVGNAIPDAHLAALAIESGAEIASHDRGFARYPGVRVFDPLAE